MMRNTSPIGWIPLLAHKVLFKGALIPFILSGIFVAVPIIGLCTFVDSLYYGGEGWTFTGINFLKVNVVHGLSKYFGEDPWYWYIGAFAPLNYTAIYPLVLFANTFGHLSL
jgi:phosphatidylinositol glycan class B